MIKHIGRSHSFLQAVAVPWWLLPRSAFACSMPVDGLPEKILVMKAPPAEPLETLGHFVARKLGHNNWGVASAELLKIEIPKLTESMSLVTVILPPAASSLKCRELKLYSEQEFKWGKDLYERIICREYVATFRFSEQEVMERVLVRVRASH